jgi:CHAT domain-containing protein
MGQYEKSFINIQKNIWLGKLPNASAGERWRALNAISRYFFSLEKYNTSLVFGKEALTLAEKLGDPTWTFTSLIDLSVVNSALGNYDEALNLIEKGEKFTETLKDSNYKNKCIAHINLQLGNINRQKHLYSEAIENYQKASDFYDSGKFQVNGYESHVGSLLSSIASKNEIGIESELPKILEIFKIYRKEIIEEQNRNSFFNNEQDVYDIATDYEFEKNNFEKAFDYTEESRSRSLLDLQYSLAEVSTEEKTPVIKFSKNLTEPFKLSDIQNQMPANTQLLVYSVLPEKTLIWIITKDSIDTAKTQISSEVLQEKIVNYLKLIEKHDELNNQLTSSKELYQILILPIKDKLDKNKQIVIIPDKILFRLPFDTLYSDKYFLEDYTISYSPSANVFLNCTNKAKGFDLGNSETLLSIGNPHFKVNEYKNLEDLPSAKDEAKEIAPLYKNSKILVENQATKEAFKANLQNADVIHFAGHYIVEEKNSLLSSLVLAGETKEESDLANYEIISENFSQTRLIILSACETGIETYYNGEGMMGASRTFLAKNVPLVIASQWKVETKASKKLMVHFHQLRKNEKLSTAEALRQAQLTMLKEENYNQPYYWAAFTTLGGYAQF